MDHKLFREWLTEEKKKEPEKSKNFFILVGPPAVGKSSWINDFIEITGQTYAVISRDQIIEDDIFPRYKLTNRQLFQTIPPKDANYGDIVPGFEKYGVVVRDNLERKAFEKIVDVNKEIDDKINKEISNALSVGTENILIDGTNSLPEIRKRYLSKVTKHPEYKKIAVFFEFEGYEEEIHSRSEKRAIRLSKELGKDFGRDISKEEYGPIFARFVKPHKSEGFDEIISYDSFKGVNTATMEPTAESLTIAFRKFLEEQEQEILEEARLNRAFKREAKQKARRNEEKYGYKHRKWAENRQKKWNSEHPELEELYLKEIENATAAAKAAREYLQKRRELRKKKLEEKEKARFEKRTGKKRKTLPSPYEGEGPETKNFPYKKGRTGGVAKVYQKRAKKAASFAQGEQIPAAGIGPMAEEIEIIPQQEEKGDGKYRS